LEFYNQALPLERSIGDSRGEALTLSNIALLYDDAGENQKAIDYYNQSLPLFRANRDQKKEADTLDLIGNVYSKLGEIVKAADYYAQAIRIQRAIGDRASEAGTLHNTAALYYQFGKNQEALNLLNKALVIMRAIGNRSGEATTLITTGTVYSYLGEMQKALDYYNQALAIVKASGARGLEAPTLVSIGWAYDSLGEKEKALEYLNQALTILKVIPDRSLEADVLNGIGGFHRTRGELQKSLELYNQALLLMRATGDRRGEAYTLYNIAAIHSLRGESQKAQEYYNQALPIQIISGDRGGEATTLSDLMAFWGTRNVPLAVFYGKQAVNIYQKLRANITSQDKEVQKNFLRTKEKTYRILAHLLISLDRLPEAQQVLNLFKDQQFFDFNQNIEKTATRLTPTAREAMMRDKYGRAFNEDQVKAALNEAEAEFAQPGAQKDKVGEIADTRELQTALRELGRQTGQKAVAVYTLVGDSNFRALLVTPDSITATSQQIPGDALNEKALQLWGLLQSDKYDPTALAGELYSIVFKPIEAQLPKDTNTILWSLDGNLRYVPMSALHDGKQYLVERYNNIPFTRSNSERLLRAVSSRWTGLGLGSSEAHTVELLGEKISFNALPGVTEELRALFHEKDSPAGVLEGEVLPDARFTKVAMLNALKHRRPLVHISSHFSFRPGDEARSFLLLGDGTPMTLEEMKQQTDLFAGVELLTLSACNTAAQQSGANGREIDGFAELAQRLGAGSVMATLWPVADNSTPWLMREFYQTRENGGGLTKAEAFRRAQLALLNGTAQTKPLPAAQKGPSSSVQIVIGKRNGGTRGEIVYVAEKDAPAFKRDESKPFSHPYYWAPFILIGNWK
jgi:CHAT domain-containing protein/Tfp pilus assembly protein PilF